MNKEFDIDDLVNWDSNLIEKGKSEGIQSAKNQNPIVPSNMNSSNYNLGEEIGYYMGIIDTLEKIINTSTKPANHKEKYIHL